MNQSAVLDAIRRGPALPQVVGSTQPQLGRDARLVAMISCLQRQHRHNRVAVLGDIDAMNPDNLQGLSTNGNFVAVLAAGLQEAGCTLSRHTVGEFMALGRFNQDELAMLGRTTSTDGAVSFGTLIDRLEQLRELAPV